MIITWGIIYWKTKSTLMQEYNLDTDLRKQRGLRPAALAQNALNNFKKNQRDSNNGEENSALLEFP